MNEFFEAEWDYIPPEVTPHPYHSFAIDDALQETVSSDGSFKFRAWTHHPFVILGLHDARLPHLHDGLAYLSKAGYDYIVRNSGGLGVVLDEGVLNISLVMNKSHSPSIDDGYDLMLALVRDVLDGADVEAYEIHGSYCPGSYDLSIDGRKFAGISQRRIRDGVAVQIYLCVTGSGAARAEVMKEFYGHAKKDAETRFQYPDIEPDVMASLNELLGKSWTVDDMLDKFLDVLKIGPKDTGTLPEEFDGRYTEYVLRMIRRNEDIRGELDRKIFSDLLNQ
ncbi:lipoate--protein ligase family protein [Salinicoccus halitifaciens]|uniref:Octanoyl-[GcvH]:protein N-octanoyltransferase n=1 Tax=Salinicoccus halitifaciens TaxID=1073415 RepID=A0ABV2EBE4_9STAP|nr:lipoate--protein ligase family protein [Salinicoccus halitifaciens]MCD2138242.1 lipoate--protein ligase family protein [Salinicoccus halitifaciens]